MYGTWGQCIRNLNCFVGGRQQHYCFALFTYKDRLVFSRVGTTDVTRHFNRSADNDGGEKPRTVLDPSGVSNGNEQEAVDDAAYNCQRKRRVIGPDGAILVGHVG